MPIRRAATTPPQETPPKSNQDGDPDASSEESVSAGEDQEPESAPATAPPKEGEEPVAAEGEEKEPSEETAEKPPEETVVEEGQGEKTGDEAAGKEKEKEKEKEKVKKIKRRIPAWATMSASRRALAQKSSMSPYNQPKMDDILLEAIKACKNKASSYAIRQYIMKNYASLELDRRSYLLKKSLRRLLEKGAIKQLKGTGFNGSFTICKQPQKSAGKQKQAPAPPAKTETLGDSLPLIMTHLCEPKEASYILIKKYLEQHFPQLNIEHRPDLLKNALQRGVEKGHLEQITGKGASGTFQIKRTGDKPLPRGGPLDEAIITAITAMNEPKTCSITIMRKFLLEKHKDSKVSLLVNNLRRTLKTCKMRGWMEQISGNGFNGTYQLSYPFYPSPAILFPEKQKRMEKPKQKRSRKEESSDEEEEEDSEEEEEEESEESESEDEPPPKKRKQQKKPPAKVRRPPPAKKVRHVAGEVPRKPRSLLRSGLQLRRSVPPAKKPASSKAKATKKSAPAAKPKTPVARKMTSRAPKRLTPKSPGAKAKPAARRSQKSRK
ncbi:hypothetical protein GJAV_G00189880 [Gymnothorax javanicus]|nr:hypothetical protein GJAV_G00189880 [Gymnothorax javanicus]